MPNFDKEIRRLRRRGSLTMVGPLLLAFAVSGCGDLLEVELPGNITEADLEDPRLARTLALSAQGDFDCWMTDYIEDLSLWTTEILYVFTSGGQIVVNLRDDWQTNTWDAGGAGDCTGGFYQLMHIARVQAENAAERITAFDVADVPDQDFLVGFANAYAGYVYQLAGEAYCQLAFDGGPLVTREDAWRIAEQRFTTALDFAGRVTSGPDAAEAKSIVNMARVGRARARLNLGDLDGAVTDASAVDPGFIRYAETSAVESKRYNDIYQIMDLEQHAAIAPPHDLMVGGVLDPRVPVFHYGLGTGFDGVTDMWGQRKFNSLGAWMPFSTYREAQLMIAEARGGQVAVDIINDLRSDPAGSVPAIIALWPTGGLPAYAGGSAAEIEEQVREERRRELWFQGTRIGDKLRWNESWLQGFSLRGREYNASRTCVPLHQVEFDTNPNL